MRKKLIQFLCTSAMFAGILNSYGQSFDDAIDRKENPIRFSDAVQWSLRYTDAHGRYTIGERGWTGNILLRFDESENENTSYHMENSLIGDLIYRIIHYKTPSYNEQAFGSGILGWHQFYIDGIKKDRLILSAGPSFGDYLFGSERIDTVPQVLEPNGYLFYCGPAFRASYLITNGFFIDGFFRYDIGFKLMGRDDAEDLKGYPKPHFITIGGAIYHKSHLFANVRLIRMVDRGDNNDAATRFDLSLGIWTTIGS
jgi:hypothetical protein